MDLIFDDAEKGDLINTDVNDTVRPEIEEIIENYKWNFGFKQYFKFLFLCVGFHWVNINKLLIYYIII